MNLKTILPVLAFTTFIPSGFSQIANKVPDSLIIKNIFIYKNGNFEGKIIQPDLG